MSSRRFHVSRTILLSAAVFAVVASVAGRGQATSEPLADRSMLSVRVVDEAGEDLDARIRLEPLDLVARVQATVAQETRRMHLAVHGRLELPLGAGSYRIVVSHGPEFGIVRRSIRIRADERTSTEIVLRRWVDPGPYRAADFHVHTDESEDGRVPLETRLASLRAEGLSIAALTDHNHVTRAHGGAEGELLVVPGVEVTTWAPEVGHFNVFPADRAPEYRGRTPDSIFAEVHRTSDRLVQVNHPRLLDHIAYFGLAGLRKDGSTRAGFGLDFDLLEVWNGYDLGRPDALWSGFREWLALVARGHRIAATGNSDSHDLERTWVGYPRTYVELGPEAGQADLTRALAAGRSYVTTGPLLDVRIGDSRPGGTAAIGTDGRVSVHIRVMAAPHVGVDRVDVWLDDRWIRSERVRRSDAAIRFDRTLRVDAEGARTLVVAVRGDRPMSELLPGRPVRPAAFTNPIHLHPGASGPRSLHAARR